MSSTSQSEGFLLLTIDNAQLLGPNLNEHGLLCLQCITISESGNPQAVVDDGEQDIWLVLRMNNYEMPISPLDPITHSKVNNTYLFHTLAGENVVLTLPIPSDLTHQEDLETFQVLLEQYGVVQYESDDGVSASPKDSQKVSQVGKLILVDEEDGHVVGSLENFTIKEDSSLSEAGNEKNPVIIDLPEDPDQPAVVSTLRPEYVEGAFKPVDLLSRGIIFATNALASGMGSAASYYISKSTPREKPLLFSERTKGNLRRVHNISGTVFEVTSKTTGLIHDSIDRMVSVFGRKKASPKPPAQTPQEGTLIPPRLGDRSPMSGSRSGTLTPTKRAKEKPRFINRILISTDLLLTTLEKSGTALLNSGTQNLCRSLAHKYGQDTGQAALVVGQTAQNVGAVYVDMRGIGRRALIRRAGKGVVKGMIGGREVILGAQAQIQDTLGRSSTSSTSSPVLSVTSSQGYKPPLPPRRPSPAPPAYEAKPKEKK